MKNLIKRILKEEEDLQWVQDAISGEIRPTRSLILKPQANTIKNAIETHTEVMHGDGDSYDKTHENNIFLTLTYDNDHLTSNKLVYLDFQLFMKSLREKVY